MTSMPEFLVALATSRFDVDTANRKLTAKRADRTTDEPEILDFLVEPGTQRLFTKHPARMPFVPVEHGVLTRPAPRSDTTRTRR